MTIVNLPAHIAIIMDGNGRWAKKRLLPRIAGHRAGVEAARNIVKACAKKQIKVLSLFAFSSENWLRPPQEVNYLMDLFLTGLEKELDMLKEYNIQLRFIGNRNQFNEKLLQKIAEVERTTANHSGMKLLIAADYGGQWDITQAVQKLVHDVEQKILTTENVNADEITKRLSFADLPNPDFFIRTSGEIRISNFMLWQLAYSELYFTDTLWPDFDDHELDKALHQYAARDRRYGQVQTGTDN